MRYFGLGFLVVSALAFGRPEVFLGKYETKFAGAEARGIIFKEKEQESVGDKIDLEKIAKPKQVSSFEVKLDKEMKLQLSGADFPATRELEENEKNGRAISEVHSGLTGMDEETKCKFQLAKQEMLLSDGKELRLYGLLTLFALEDVNSAECKAYQDKVFRLLNEKKKEDFVFFAAMQAGKVIEEGKPFPNVLILATFYSASEVDENKPVLPGIDAGAVEDTWSGVFNLKYAKRSLSQVWSGKGNSLVSKQGEEFDLNDFGPVGSQEPLLIMFDATEGSITLAGAGSQDTRECKASPDTKDLYVCSPLFGGNEEEAGTGCKITHYHYEMVYKDANQNVHYSRWERRTFSSETVEGCQAYRKKTSEELKQGGAELFWRILLKTGALESPDSLGEVGQIGHQYSTERAY